MGLANQIAGLPNQTYLKSNWVNQCDFLPADIDWRKVYDDLKIFSWVGWKMLLVN